MKFFKRLGAVTGAVALLAGGLVGVVAGPATADHPDGVYNMYIEVPSWDQSTTTNHYWAQYSADGLGIELAGSGYMTGNQAYCQTAAQQFVEAHGGEELDFGNAKGIKNNKDNDDCTQAYLFIPFKVQHKDVVCAYEVSRYLSSEGAATKSCKDLLKEAQDIEFVSETRSEKAANGKYLFTATVSTEYLNEGLDFVSPAEPSDWDECPEGLFPTGNGCEEEIVLGGPESRECDDGDVLDDGECREWEELVNIPGDSQGISLVDREDLVDRELDVNGDGELETVPLFDPNTPEEDTWVPGLRNDSPPSG